MRRMTICMLFAALALAGCGSSNDKSSSSGSADKTATPTATATQAASSGGGGETVKLSADASALKFDKTALSAKAGKVTLSMDNPSGIPHAIAIEGNGVDVDGKIVQKGGTSTASADLKAGTYDFYCPVGNHRAAGMEGKLTVK
ncbi:MAG: plastocyanin/azurin family copper-binding protein [Solirubrobacteraceae bacterium]